MVNIGDLIQVKKSGKYFNKKFIIVGKCLGLIYTIQLNNKLKPDKRIPLIFSNFKNVEYKFNKILEKEDFFTTITYGMEYKEDFVLLEENINIGEILNT